MKENRMEAIDVESNIHVDVLLSNVSAPTIEEDFYAEAKSYVTYKIGKLTYLFEVNLKSNDWWSGINFSVTNPIITMYCIIIISNSKEFEKATTHCKHITLKNIYHGQ